jgi:ribosomal protein L37E
MTGRAGGRNKRYLWRCRACGEQYTVRTGAIY